MALGYYFKFDGNYVLERVVVKWLEQLGYGAESRRKREFAMRQLENSLCQSSCKWVPFFELGKDKAAKGEGWAPPFNSCAKDTVGL